MDADWLIRRCILVVYLIAAAASLQIARMQDYDLSAKRILVGFVYGFGVWRLHARFVGRSRKHVKRHIAFATLSQLLYNALDTLLNTDDGADEISLGLGAFSGGISHTLLAIRAEDD